MNECILGNDEEAQGITIDTIGGERGVPPHPTQPRQTDYPIFTRIPADCTDWVPEVRKSSTRKMVGACDLNWA